MSAGKKEKAKPLGQRIIEGFQEFHEALKEGGRIEERFTVRTVSLDLRKLDPKSFAPDEIRGIRESLNASQAIFAKLLGVASHTISAWECGRKEPTLPARRILEEITNQRGYWAEKLQSAVKSTSSKPDTASRELALNN